MGGGVNYQRMLDGIITSLAASKETDGRRPTLLLHACCAPCSSYCVEYLAAHFDILLFFYNPNMESAAEYDKRSAELLRLIERMEEDGTLKRGSVRAHICSYEPGVFEEMARGLESEPERGARCRKCYEMRMRAAAAVAAREGFDYFTTTLSISPLKNAQWINEIGISLQEEYGVRHLPSDFKKKGGFLRSTELSERYGLYRQDYCGCRFSKNRPVPET